MSQKLTLSQATFSTVADGESSDTQSLTQSDDDSPTIETSPCSQLASAHHSPQAVQQDIDPLLWRIHGNDYNLAAFVPKHPGGQLAILSGRGRDCTALFESYHPWNDKHRKVLKAYGAEPPPPDPFYEDLKAGVRKAFPGGRGTTKMWLRTKIGLSTAWCIMTWCFFWVRTPTSCALAGVFVALFGTRLSHEGGHFQVSTREWANRLAQFLGYFLTGPSMGWFYRHTISHHCHTNQEHDVDVEYIWIADKLPAWLKVIATPFLPVGVMIEIGAKYLFVDYFATRRVGGNLIVDRWMGNAVPEFLVWLSVHWFFGPSWWCYLSMFWVAGAIFIPMSQVAHVIVFPDHQKYDSWAKMQIAESVDFAADSDFWFHVAFGLTTQVEHHLFPGLGHQGDGPCREVVRDACKQHGVTYYDVTAKKALGALWRRWMDGTAVPLA